jgi:hypothetical protein
MGPSVTLVVLAAFIIGSIGLIFSKRERRAVLRGRLHIRRRRTSGSGTPPRSLSPGKKESDNGASPDYSDAFPPSRRHTLSEIEPSLPVVFGKSKELLAQSLPAWKKTSLPMKAFYLDHKTHAYTPTEFSIEEVKALGDFPDYAALSGVPLPRPYPEFDIKKALPRPYRPFRWAYYQTMCMSDVY